MPYHFNFGVYEDSYLVIRLNILDSLEKLRELEKVDQALFFHEYTHFLQNITSVFGRNHIWQTYDRIRQLIAFIQNDSSKDLTIPSKMNEAEMQRKLNRITKHNSGQFGLGGYVNDLTAKIESFKISSDKELDELKPGNGVRFITLQISDENNNTCDYLFGDIAVSETMAFLIESKHFQGEWNNFPYRSCFLFAKHLGLNLDEKPELMFTICDSCLFSSYPGWMFFENISRMVNENFVPENPEDIYEFSFHTARNFYMDVWADLEASKMGINIIIDKLLANEYFKSTGVWLKHILEGGYQARKHNMAFMLQAYREPDLFEGFWKNVVADFGTPHIINRKDERVFSAPIPLKSLEHEIDPIFLLALKQLNQTILSGSTKCELVSICEKSTNGLRVDDRCLNAPWERAKDEMTCAFGALWANYGLSEKEIKIIPRV